LLKQLLATGELCRQRRQPLRVKASVKTVYTFTLREGWRNTTVMFIS